MRPVALARLVYIALTIGLGSLLIVGAVMSLWEGIQRALIIGEPGVEFDVTTGARTIVNPYGLDGPSPLSFYNYGRLPVTAVMLVLIGFATLKYKWETLSLACWFLMAGVVVETLSFAFDFGWVALIPGVESIWVYIPLVGVLVALVAKSRRSTIDTASSPIAKKNRYAFGSAPIETVLAAIVAVSYLWRAIAIALSPEATWAIDYLRGTPNQYAGSVVLVVGSAIGLGVAMGFVVGTIAVLSGTHRTMNAVFAFTAGLTFGGFLQILDSIFSLQTSLNAEYALQEAIAFVACVAALAISARRGQGAILSPSQERVATDAS